MKKFLLTTLIIFNIRHSLDAQTWTQLSDNILESNSEWVKGTFSYNAKGNWLASEYSAYIPYDTILESFGVFTTVALLYTQYRF